MRMLIDSNHGIEDGGVQNVANQVEIVSGELFAVCVTSIA
jgi:hypothetical protein